MVDGFQAEKGVLSGWISLIIPSSEEADGYQKAKLNGVQAVAEAATQVSEDIKKKSKEKKRKKAKA